MSMWRLRDARERRSRPSGSETLIELGINHEQQHQELLLTDILSLFARAAAARVTSPQAPASPSAAAAPLDWSTPSTAASRHRPRRRGLRLRQRGATPRGAHPPLQARQPLVTNGECMPSSRTAAMPPRRSGSPTAGPPSKRRAGRAALLGGGRRRLVMQMSLPACGPSTRPRRSATSATTRPTPSLAGPARGCPPSPSGSWRLRGLPVTGELLGAGRLRPMPAEAGGTRALDQMYGDVWEWTGERLSPLSRLQAAPGAVGEYNGKFMCNQFVLRGGSCATPDGHIRADLSQLLLSSSALAVHGAPAGCRSVMERALLPPRRRRARADITVRVV